MKLELSKYDRSRGLHLPYSMSPELAYFLGVMAGDGSINYRAHKKEYEIKCVGNPRDEQQFYKRILRPLIKFLFGLDVQTKLFDKGTTFGFRIYSKTLSLYLHSLGLPIGSKYARLCIPHSITEQMKIHFIRGIFDTDGCVSFKKRSSTNYYPTLSITSRSEAFIKEIHSFLVVQGFKVNIYLSRKQFDKRFKLGYSISSRIEMNGRRNLEKWTDEIGFWNPKHWSKISSEQI